MKNDIKRMKSSNSPVRTCFRFGSRYISLTKPLPISRRLILLVDADPTWQEQSQSKALAQPSPCPQSHDSTLHVFSLKHTSPKAPSLSRLSKQQTPLSSEWRPMKGGCLKRLNSAADSGSPDQACRGRDLLFSPGLSLTLSYC